MASKPKKKKKNNRLNIIRSNTVMSKEEEEKGHHEQLYRYDKSKNIVYTPDARMNAVKKRQKMDDLEDAFQLESNDGSPSVLAKLYQSPFSNFESPELSPATGTKAAENQEDPFPFEDPSVKYAENNFDVTPNKSFIIKNRDRTRSIGRPPLASSVDKRKRT